MVAWINNSTTSAGITVSQLDKASCFISSKPCAQNTFFSKFPVLIRSVVSIIISICVFRVLPIFVAFNWHLSDFNLCVIPGFTPSELSLLRLDILSLTRSICFFMPEIENSQSLKNLPFENKFNISSVSWCWSMHSLSFVNLTRFSNNLLTVISQKCLYISYVVYKLYFSNPPSRHLTRLSSIFFTSFLMNSI